MKQKPAPLSAAFQDALTYAVELHRGQLRKSSRTPYVGHLLGVVSLVLEAGGTETEAIAALLHDAVEDQGGRETLQEIRTRFGDSIADIVDALTDAYTVPKPPWKERKERFLISLQSAPPPVQLVALADKVHNARSLHRELLVHGDRIWNNFTGRKEGTLWYYRSLVSIFEDSDFRYLADELIRLVALIHHLAKVPFSR